MNSWLKCSLEQGMFPNEYAVAVDTLDAGKISFFAPDFKVDADQNLVSVEVFDTNDAGILVRLPAPPYEISSQNVRVHIGALVPPGA